MNNLWVDSPGDQSAGQWEVGTGAAMVAPGPGNGAHISLAAVLLALIGLKAFTESNLISTDLAEIKVSLLNMVTLGAMVIPTIVGFKLLTDAMAARGVALPGQVELARAI